MANSATYPIGKRRYCVRIGSYTQGYGVKDSSTGKWSNTRTWHLIVPYTEDTNVTVAKAATDSPIGAASVTFETFTAPADSIGGSTTGASFTFEGSSNVKTLTRADESGFYNLTEVARQFDNTTASHPYLQSAGDGTPIAYTPTADDILVSDRTYTQAIGTADVGFGVYDPKTGLWSNHRQATIIARFRERQWEHRALTTCTADAPSLFYDTYDFAYGLIGYLQHARFDYEYQKIESSCARATPNGFFTKTTLFKQTIGIGVA